MQYIKVESQEHILALYSHFDSIGL
jgi:hypothetical protein